MSPCRQETNKQTKQRTDYIKLLAIFLQT